MRLRDLGNAMVVSDNTAGFGYRLRRFRRGCPVAPSAFLTLAMILAMVSTSGCGGSGIQAPVGRYDDWRYDDRRARQVSTPDGYHTVRPRDTLYAIAWAYGKDYLDLARWNGISAPYRIHPGQRVRVTGPPRSRAPLVPRKSHVEPGVPAPTPPPVKEPAVRKPSPPGSSSPGTGAKAAEPSAVQWRWPTRGRVLSTFAQSGNTGLDIGGRLGQPIRAAADGLVVYSGNGLVGYGELVIVKHNEKYLTAYAHNKERFADEGDAVSAGQRIANMGRSRSGRTMLHFEIRRDGRPVDPIAHLPR